MGHLPTVFIVATISLLPIANSMDFEVAKKPTVIALKLTAAWRRSRNPFILAKSVKKATLPAIALKTRGCHFSQSRRRSMLVLGLCINVYLTLESLLSVQQC